MLRALPMIIWFVLLVYALIDCIQADEGRLRNLPKVGWLLLIILVPIAGPIVYLIAGRPNATSARRNVPWPSTRTAGYPEYERPRRSAPDDDPEFLASIRKSDAQHEQMLRDWEQQLRERERKLDEKNDEGDDPPPPSSAP